MHSRPDRVTYFMEIANIVAKRSTCTRAQVGAVLVSDNRIISCGYNGSTRGAPHCIDDGCLIYDSHCIRTIHAEMNALLYLEHSYKDLILYCTHQPCYKCFQALTIANVTRIYYKIPYSDNRREFIMRDYKDDLDISPYPEMEQFNE